VIAGHAQPCDFQCVGRAVSSWLLSPSGRRTGTRR